MKRSKAEKSRNRKRGSTAVTSSLVPGSDSLDCINFAVIAGKRGATEPGGQNRLPTLQELEQEYIRRVLSHVNDNRSKAAAILGIDRVSLWRKIKRHGAGTVVAHTED